MDTRKATQKSLKYSIQVSRGCPETNEVKLVSECNQRDNLLSVSPSGRESTANTTYRYVVTVIVFLAARLPEFPIPEALVFVHLEAECFKRVDDGVCVFYGDNDIVTIDAHLTKKRMNTLLGELALGLSFNPDETNGQEDHRLERKAESRTHRCELG
jgi:hypothetical protein